MDLNEIETNIQTMVQGVMVRHVLSSDLNEGTYAACKICAEVFSFRFLFVCLLMEGTMLGFNLINKKSADLAKHSIN